MILLFFKCFFFATILLQDPKKNLKVSWHFSEIINSQEQYLWQWPGPLPFLMHGWIKAKPKQYLIKKILTLCLMIRFIWIGANPWDRWLSGRLCVCGPFRWIKRWDAWGAAYHKVVHNRCTRRYILSSACLIFVHTP